MNKKILQKQAKQHGTPLFVIDHKQLLKKYFEFINYLPRVQVYYAVKANSDPDIVKTLYEAGCSFDVASMSEFRVVYENIRTLPEKERQDFIWNKIIYANPIKAMETLEELNQFKPLVTYDNYEEIQKIKKHAPHAGLVLRIKVPNTGAMVELSSKFGASPTEALDLIEAAHLNGLTVEGLSFHVGSQTTNIDNYHNALELTSLIFKTAWSRGFNKLKILDIGGGFPVTYDQEVTPFKELAKILNRSFDKLFPKHIEIIAEPGRFLVATAATCVAKIISRTVREGKLCYYINDGVYHTFSGIIFDHCSYHLQAFKKGPTQICSVFGPTCDALDTISLAEELPQNLAIGDLLYCENIGAYSHASSTHFNGFPPAKVIHYNQ